MDSKQFERVKTAVVQADAEQCIELEALVRQVAARRQGEIVIAQKAHSLSSGRDSVPAAAIPTL